MNEQPNIKTALRWIVFFPAATIAALLTFMSLDEMSRFSLMRWSKIDQDGFIRMAFKMVIASNIMGAVFVYVGAKVAPAHNKIVAYAVSGFGFIGIGLVLFPALFITPNPWTVLGCLSFGLSSGVTAYCIRADHTKVES